MNSSLIKIRKIEQSRINEFDFNNIIFGKNPTDHIFLADYHNKEWSNLRIEPFSNLSLSPIALGLHYGQSVFEGMKAYRLNNNEVVVFRPEKHYERLNKSLKRMCMPEIPHQLFSNAIYTLLQIEESWVKNINGSSLYIRPFMIATEERLGVKISDEYLFGIVCMPMGMYYSSNLKVKVETKYSRASEGGTGDVKCAGNYGNSFLPTHLAKQEGFDQILWTDSIQHEYIEESGTMNVMFVIDDVIITPPLTGTILDGVTRDSLIKIAKDLNFIVEERKISYKELELAFIQNKKIEAFGVGTAAVISIIESISINDKLYHTIVNPTSIACKLKKVLNDIKSGSIQDKNNWLRKIDYFTHEDDDIVEFKDSLKLWIINK
ncbi:MAG: branched-chain amino acid aminotransferase [Bacteroidetes bacterium]|nr:branched-chain amino acid aminotransferase [Bacteroidota bacterium]